MPCILLFNDIYLQPQSQREKIISLKVRAISSVGLEHLPYKQGVVGSNPSSPTKIKCKKLIFLALFFKLTNSPNVVFRGVFFYSLYIAHKSFTDGPKQDTLYKVGMCNCALSINSKEYGSILQRKLSM